MIRNIVYQIASFIVLGLVAVSCSDDLVEGAQAPGGQDDFWSQFDFVIADDADTRVAYDTYKRSTFEAGDEVGIYVVDANGNLISGQPTNVHYVVRDVTDLNTGERRQVLLPSNPNISVGKDASYRYILYYPYNVNMTLTALKSYTHTIDTDQNASSSTYAPELTAFEHSDLLWCYYAPQADKQTFEVYFDHAMAQIVVELDESEVYAPDDNAENTGVYLLNMPVQASNINLLQSWSETFSYATTLPTYTEGSTVENPKIHAWKFGTGASGKLLFRAMVPAHTIDSEDDNGIKRPVVRIYSSAQNYVDYKLKSDLDLKPGYTYTFTFSKGQTTTDFEVSEDDSWVLDVLDPETGTPVGLLCREYLRYQPNGVSYRHTGDQIPGGSKYINSQAWVFYNLREDGTPKLETGTVLRFTYDVQAHFNSADGGSNAFGDTQAFLPAPHVSNTDGKGNGSRQGIFLPKHGYYWTSAKYYKYLKDGKYGTELIVPEAKEPKLNEQNYYMHGGTVTWAWDASNNHSYISNFTLPTKDQYTSSNIVTVDGTEQTIGDKSGYITNKQAYYFGHIAISYDGQVGVSYQPISANDKYKDEAGNKVGILQPHYLIDRRITASGTVEENRYPLVKIGHNQFWMSKSLQAKTFTDGTPITCYNTPGTTENPKPASVTFSDSEIVGAGYIYPFSQTITSKNGNYDPYNDRAEMDPTPGNLYPDMEFSVAPMYNKPAVEDERFVPQSTDSRLYYQMPTSDQVKDMQGYFSKHFAAKISTDMFMKKVDGIYVNSYENYSRGYYSALYGLICDDTGNHYCANISGFNLKARGYFDPINHQIKCLNTDAVIILKSKVTSQIGVDYYQFPLYAPFASNDETLLNTNLYNYNDYYPTQLFAQVRMVMKYRNQLDNGGASTRSILQSFSNPAPTVSQQATDKRHVRIVLE
ncbi:fimbrillin family protein [uncultured Bacteroides sp.]|uniref:fimbrillin family protein n=1 Tax=uncultured Bacteroides sp. TaxID=162156 RepID=UPI00262E46C0|nr:fimbrillin family protein [uncultured Bacteroides sp.]